MTAFIEHGWTQKAKVKFRWPQNYSVFRLEDLINEPNLFRILYESVILFMVYMDCFSLQVQAFDAA